MFPCFLGVTLSKCVFPRILPHFQHKVLSRYRSRVPFVSRWHVWSRTRFPRTPVEYRLCVSVCVCWFVLCFSFYLYPHRGKKPSCPEDDALVQNSCNVLKNRRRHTSGIRNRNGRGNFLRRPSHSPISSPPPFPLDHNEDQNPALRLCDISFSIYNYIYWFHYSFNDENGQDKAPLHIGVYIYICI